MSALETLATNIFANEFDSDNTFVSYDSILGWLTENLGLLNTLINTDFEGIDVELLLEEQAIYRELYLYNYYTRQARNVLRGITSTNSSDNIILVADEGNRIQFTNKNEVSKTYRDLAKDCKQNLDSLVAKYNIYGAKPLQVGGVETFAPDIGPATSSANMQALGELLNTISTSQLPGQTVTLDGGADD